MNIETGIVISADDNRVVVEADCVSACSSCASNGACGVMQGPSTRTISIENTIGAKKGDTVEWGLREGGILISSVILYLMPVIFLFAGIFSGPYIIPALGELSSLICGVAGLGLSFAAAWAVSKRVGKTPMFTPVLIRIVEK